MMSLTTGHYQQAEVNLIFCYWPLLAELRENIFRRQQTLYALTIQFLFPSNA